MKEDEEDRIGVPAMPSNPCVRAFSGFSTVDCLHADFRDQNSQKSRRGIEDRSSRSAVASSSSTTHKGHRVASSSGEKGLKFRDPSSGAPCLVSGHPR